MKLIRTKLKDLIRTILKEEFEMIFEKYKKYDGKMVLKPGYILAAGKYGQIKLKVLKDLGNQLQVQNITKGYKKVPYKLNKKYFIGHFIIENKTMLKEATEPLTEVNVTKVQELLFWKEYKNVQDGLMILGQLFRKNKDTKQEKIAKKTYEMIRDAVWDSGFGDTDSFKLGKQK